MATYPSGKTHRPSRRKLGKGQQTIMAPATVVVTSATDTITLTFSVPVVVNGIIPGNISGGLTLVAQVVVSPTVVTQQMSAAVAAKTYNYPVNTPQIRTQQGGGFAGASGTL